MKQNADGYYSKSFYIDLPNGQKKQIKVRGKTKEEVLCQTYENAARLFEIE